MPGGAKTPTESGSCVRGATHDLNLFPPTAGTIRIGLDPAHAKPVRIRMLRGLSDAGNAKRSKARRRILDTLYFMAKIRKSHEQLFQRHIGLQMFSEPGECELHREIPFPRRFWRRCADYLKALRRERLRGPSFTMRQAALPRTTGTRAI